MSIYRPNELYHYGVLGMKWGVRRAAKKGTTYSYKSWGTKRNEFKSKVVQGKLSSGKKMSDRRTEKLKIMKAKYDRRAKISSELDKREQDYSKHGTIAGTIAGRAVVSTITNGAFTYKGKTTQQMSAMMSRTKNIPVSDINKDMSLWGERFVKSTLTNYLVPGASHTVKAVYMRKGERQYINDRFGTRKERRERRKQRR